ncbi:UDP-N-acetylglucosamine transporter TMEM241 homolog [Lineus longissimus]|uniref:UDP-N-acetylglucosamine transporter TMEM241 homolog n=1 Tax=Lineus longissimus TaxID=88925 RepID=UPI002B4E180D
MVLRAINRLPIFFTVLFITTYFVNKYVLSVLRFTYPCIFQGWQTLVGAVMLKTLHSTHHIEMNLKEADRYSFLGSVPSSVFFVVAIYSGSKALSKLAIPFFLTVHNVIAFVNSLGDFIINRELIHPIRYFMVVVILMSAMFIGHIDPQYDFDGYVWMVVHVISMGVYNVYSNTFGPHLVGLGGLEKLLICYVVSCIVLGPSSYFLGDALRASQFPFFHFYKFYIGCILSGVCGCLLNMCAIYMRETGSSGNRMNVEYYAAVAKVLSSVLSIHLFDVKLTIECLFWMGINMVMNIAVTHPKLYEAFSPSKKSDLNMDKTKQNGNHPTHSVSEKEKHSQSYNV